MYLPHSCICVVWEVRGQNTTNKRSDVTFPLHSSVCKLDNRVDRHTNHKQTDIRQLKIICKYNMKQMCRKLERNLNCVVKMSQSSLVLPYTSLWSVSKSTTLILFVFPQLFSTMNQPWQCSNLSNQGHWVMQASSLGWLISWIARGGGGGGVLSVLTANLQPYSGGSSIFILSYLKSNAGNKSLPV